MNDRENRVVRAGEPSGITSPRASQKTSSSAQASIPSLPDYLEHVRTDLGWSRRQVSNLGDVSLHQLRHVEHGTRNATAEVVDQLIAAYQLTAAQARYIRELLMPAVPLPYPPGLGSQVRRTPDLIAHLAELEDRGVLGIYTDPIGNVLALNTPMRAAFPELEQIGNTIRWWFSPPAPQAVVDWDTETDLVVAWFKAAIARHRSAPEVGDLLGDLSRHGAFLWPWVHSTRVVYTRPTDTPLRLRRLPDGREYSVIVQSNEESDSRHIRLHTMIPLERSDRGSSAR